MPAAAPGTAQAGTQLDAARLAEIDGAIGAALAERKMPGAVFRLERNGAVYENAYGRFSYEPDAAPVTAGTLFDAASLTKVIATAPSVMLLAQDGKIDLDAKLVAYFPECANGGKETITVRHLLTHSSGLPAGLPARPAWHGEAAALALACAQALTNAPGTLFRYSDINYVLLGQLVQRVSGMPLDRFAQQRIYAPLQMRDTGYLPLRRFERTAIAPTQRAPVQTGEMALHGDFYVFLSNRVYPDDKSNVLPLYTQIGTLAAQSGPAMQP